jgi:uncharacterized membrane protein YphA (DoxX/SURF4 family)
MRTFLSAFFLAIFGANIASAHEVYVLDSAEIARAKKEPMLDVLHAVGEHPLQFIFWIAAAIAVVTVVYRISVTSKLEKMFDGFYDVLKKYASHAVQATLGLSLLACGLNMALFGIELPFSVAFPGCEMLGQFIVLIAGALILCGIFPRTTSGFVAFLYIWFCSQLGLYMLNYAMYMGVAVAIMLFGGGYDALAPAKVATKSKKKVSSKAQEKAAIERAEDRFFVIRVLYGLSLVYASLYAKFLYGGLALMTVEKYSLTEVFHFTPEFLVLGALMVEVGLGICFILGFASRFAALSALVFLMLSMGFFHEAVWPHVIIIGVGISIFMYGYDRRCLSVSMSKKTRWEPIL